MQPGEEVVVFQAYRHPLSMVSSLKYLGTVLMVEDGDWSEVISNMRKAHKWWA